MKQSLLTVRNLLKVRKENIGVTKFGKKIRAAKEYVLYIGDSQQAFSQFSEGYLCHFWKI
jgi:hypothetical protein